VLGQGYRGPVGPRPAAPRPRACGASPSPTGLLPISVHDEAPLSTTWILSGPERATQFSGHEAAMLTSTARRVPLALSKERNFSSSRCLTSECLCPSTYSTTLRGGDGLEPGTATSGCGTSRAVRHWDRAGARDQKPPAGSRQTAADGANVRRRASSGQAERPGGGGRFLTATLDA